jgi:hypothetical protein
MKNLIPTIFVALAIIGCSCDATEPPINIDPPGRRDYTWEIDTINADLVHFSGIWGSDSNDIWIIGEGGSSGKRLWHYDGFNWSSDNVAKSITPISIYGVSSTNIYIGGFGNIWNYDGNIWKEVFNLNPLLNNISWVGFEDIWGDSQNNIYAVGFADSSNIRKGIIYHFDGISWKRISTGKTHATFMQINRGRKTSSNYFICGIKENHLTSDSGKIYELSGNNLNLLHSSSYTKKNWNFICNINEEIYFTFGNQLSRYENGKFTSFIENPFQNYFQAILGRQSDDIFWSMDDGVVHFNGSDFQYILNYNSNIRFADGLLFDTKLFFLANDFTKGVTYIYKGSLD